jgi:sigma-54 dependent transcriptional regulator, acetoin dehydrogenase operon transcriptional activator AcoR
MAQLAPDDVDHQGHRREIQASWRRSRLAGLEHDAELDTVIGDVDSSSRIMQAAAPVLKDLSRQFEGFEVGTLLADRSATLVARCFGTDTLARAVDRLGALPGADFSETRSGTNAIATPFETRSALFVSRDDHFLASMRSYFCVGVPILHPVTQRIEGVIDVMTNAEVSPALMKSVMMRAARDIHQGLIESYDVNLMAVFAAFNTLRRTATDAVVMISDDIVLNNRHAVDILAPEDYVTLRGIALERPGFSGVLEVMLSSGSSATVKVTDMGDPHAVVFQLRRSGKAPLPVPRGPRPQRVGSDLDVAIDQARAEAGHVFVTGEPGAGKTWVAAQLADSADARFLDAGDVITVGAQHWVADLLRTVEAAPGVLVVDNVDLLTPQVISYLTRILRSPETPKVVLTASTRGASDADTSYLQSLCTSSVTIPPLRERAAEFDALARGIAGELAGDRVRLTLSALEALAAHTWPGNFSELARVLRDVVTRRSAGDITVNDLPAQFQAARQRHGLTRLQEIERAAIESALKGCQNNKVHAANQLGISRSTLYARIREYRLG